VNTSAGTVSRAPIIGFVLGMLVALCIGVAWLTIGSPLTWPGAARLALQERRGEEVYNANCLSCHGGRTGGTIEDSPPRHNANGHTWHHPDCAIRTMIREGSAGIFEEKRADAPQMQPFKGTLSSDDIEAVMAYIKTMWLPWQRDVQAGFTKEMCFDTN